MNSNQQLWLVLAVCLTLLTSLTTSQDRKGRKVGFNAGSHFRNEFRGENGFIEGEYGFRTPDGCMHVVRYEATKNKYKVVGTSKRDCNRRTLPKTSEKLSQSLPEIVEKMKQFIPPINNKPVSTRRPIITTKRPIITTKRPIITTKRPIITTKRPITTNRKPTTTTSKPITTTKRPLTTRSKTTRKPTTTTRKPVTTTRRPSTTSRPPITKKPTSIPPSQGRKANEILGKQIFEGVEPPPNMKRPSILSPDDPEPVYSFGFEAPGHGHTQAGLPDGRKKGEYFFDSPDGWRRIVTYEAREDGFFPKMSRVRVPGWETSPLNPKNRYRDIVKSTAPKDPAQEEKKNGETEDGEPEGKQLISAPVPSNGCPYYFYTNTRINFHWERCIENGTRVGAYGRLADDGYSHQVTYYADARGFHPKVTKTPLTREQEESVAGFTEGAFIIPKIDEEKKETERRIQEWIAQNQDRIDNPL